jgi:hypothetical protein
MEEDMTIDGINDTDTIPEHLLSYMIHATGDYGILGLPGKADDSSYLGHFANDGASNIPFRIDEVAPYVIESSDSCNAVHKDVCGCHMVTVATRDIAEGEEIFVVYGPGYWMDVNSIFEEEEDYDDGDEDSEGHGF